MIDPKQLQQDIETTVRFALAEDIGSGDITAQLIAESCRAHATVITREEAVICGQAWVDEVFKQLDRSIQVTWHVKDGDRITANQKLLEIEGPARTLLTGERTALNFLQLLSGTATICHKYAGLVEGTPVKLLDTRKTIPGLRTAQKYAVGCGGCHNHRIGLYDAFLIKENHIAACGGIENAIEQARKIAPEKPVETEVETIDEFHRALDAQADIIMLDNFTLEECREATLQKKTKNKHTLLEASGNITSSNLRQYAETGVDYISLGVLTKNCDALDLSMRLEILS